MLESIDIAESFLDFLVTEDVIDHTAAEQVLKEIRLQTTPIGRLALLAGHLSMKQVAEVLNVQSETGLRFGEQAIALGYLDRNQLRRLLDDQAEQRPSAGALLFELGLVKKGILRQKRRDFMRSLELVLA